MRLLLLGNAPGFDVKDAVDRADIVAQINRCHYLYPGSGRKTKYIFVTNTGYELEAIVDYLLDERTLSLLPGAKIIMARNSIFYALKRCALFLSTSPSQARDFRPSRSMKPKLSKAYDVAEIELLESWQMERNLWRLGMKITDMPSTGYIAFDWLRRRTAAPDAIDFAGFSFEGWDRHPWDIERSVLTANAR